MSQHIDKKRTDSYKEYKSAVFLQLVS